MAVLEMIQQKAFLGTEFVTWLWYRSEQEDNTLTVNGSLCEMHFEKDLVLTGEAGEALASTFKGDAPSLAPEAAAALLAGKKVRRARVTLAQDNVAWELTLNGETFDWGSLKIDTPPSLPFEESVPIRLNALQDFHNLFAALFEIFLDLRLDPTKWKPELKAMRKWVGKKAQGEREE
ncbi:hypothetical protein HQ520_10440 [bacterium]|nr:hypothetical protein [bacterium]